MEDERGQKVSQGDLAPTDLLSVAAALTFATWDATANHGNFTLNNMIACLIATGEWGRGLSAGAGNASRLHMLLMQQHSCAGRARRLDWFDRWAAACAFLAPADILGLVGLKSFRVAAVLLMGLLAYGERPLTPAQQDGLRQECVWCACRGPCRCLRWPIVRRGHAALSALH